MVTAEQVLKAHNRCSPINGEPYMKCMADELNRNPYEWDWSIQEDGAHVLVAGDTRLFRKNRVDGFIDVTGGHYPASMLRPDFTRSGKWHINQDNPLTECPEGLSDDAWLAIWRYGKLYPSNLQAGHIGWPDVTAFTVLEGGCDE